MSEQKHNPEVHDGITDRHDSTIPLSLRIGFVLISVLGLLWGIAFFDGSRSFADKGHWEELAGINNSKIATFADSKKEAEKYKTWMADEK